MLVFTDRHSQHIGTPQRPTTEPKVFVSRKETCFRKHQFFGPFYFSRMHFLEFHSALLPQLPFVTLDSQIFVQTRNFLC